MYVCLLLVLQQVVFAHVFAGSSPWPDTPPWLSVQCWGLDVATCGTGAFAVEVPMSDIGLVADLLHHLYFQ